MKNFGLILEPKDPEDYSFGSLGGEVIKEDGDWRNALSVFEHQRKGMESMSCVTFATLSCLEMIHSMKFGVEPNYSDRFTSFNAKTTRTGNTPKKVANAVRHNGTLPEGLWPFTDDIRTWEEFYKLIPIGLLQKGVDWSKDYDFGYEWIDDRDLREGLKRGPIGVAVHAWEQNDKGEYVMGRENHYCVLVAFEGDNPIIFDSYEQQLKTLEVGYKFKWAMLYSLYKKSGKIEEKWWHFILRLFGYDI